MNYLLFKKKIRRLAARLGILRPLKSLVIRLRGGDHQHRMALEWYAQFIKPGQLVFDVGANRGQSSELFIKLGARVVAFEPQQDLHEEIRQLCGNSPNLKIESFGLGESEDTRLLYITAYDQVASLREDWEGARIGESDVQISSLDCQIEINGLPHYCKIDVEGWEENVISGLHHAIPIISFEYHLSPSEAERAINVLNMISKLGPYKCNMKEENGHGFALPTSLSILEFRDRFPNHLGITLKDGYGDIYASLDPAAICAARMA